MIRVEREYFRDEYGRVLLLRGVNLGGSSKVPARPDGATYRRENFFQHREVSFVGRPFPLSEADEHFRRLRAWGLTFLRLLVTWEAIEHAGPGIYDEEYLDYLYQIVKKAGEYGIQLFIDPHQDVWSRFSGGDGAPGWTLEAVGFELPNLPETGAAVVHALHGDPFPKMIWPSNSGKLAAATMFTLFFAGNDFAPQTRIDGRPAQDYLQDHYFGAVRQVAERLKGLPAVVGYDTLNEPLRGYIGWRDLNRPGGLLTLGPSPSPFQSMLLGAGIPQVVDVFALGPFWLHRAGRRLLNPGRVRAWRAGYDCLWRQNGVWDVDRRGAPVLLRPDHFTQVDGRPVDFAEDYYCPFASRFIEEIRSVDPDALIFLEAEAGHGLPRWPDEHVPPGLVFAPHWYDSFVLIKKTFNPFVAVNFLTQKVVFGRHAIRRSFSAQLAFARQAACDGLGCAPALVGEFGVPFDLDHKRAYRSGDFTHQERALARSYAAVDANYLSGTLWNYTPDNNNARGDLWNDEDLSIFSRDQQRDPRDLSSGGRGLRAVVRPYPRALAGLPLSFSFDPETRIFRLAFRHDPHIQQPSEIFVPQYQYPHGCRVTISDGAYELNVEEQVLTYRHGQASREHRLEIYPA